MMLTTNKRLHFKFDLSLISFYRTELMGLATIGIILCHTYANGVLMPAWLWRVFSLGSVGTAIFFFLSGVGIWHSLQKIRFTKGEVFGWYTKRFKKLFVPFFILAIPYYAYISICDGHSFWYFISQVSTIGYWISGRGAWFVSVIVVLYLVSPWWEWLISKTGLNVLLSLFAFVFILCTNSQWLHSSRLCFFFGGFGLAPYIKKGLSIRWLSLLICSMFLYLVCLFVPKLDFIPRYVFLVPIFIILPCILFGRKWFAKTNSIWRFMGKISLESYLTNVFLPTFFIQASWVQNNFLWSNNIGYLIVVVIGVALSYFVNKLSNRILSKTSAPKQNTTT